MTNNNHLDLEFKEKICKENCFLNNLHFEYENKYINGNYILEDFFLTTKNNKIYIPYITKKKKIISYSFFSLPCKIYSEKLINLKELKKIIYEFLKDKPNTNIEYSFVLTSNYYEIQKLNFEQIRPLMVEELQSINLELDENKIFKKMKINHQNEIKKILKFNDIEVLIFDYKNYATNLIFEMMDMHKKIVGRLTRSIDTWRLNEEMINKKKGFLIKVLYKKKPISYSFFNHNNFECNYFSSITEKESFKLGGINHLSIWEAIRFAKKIGNKKFRLGTTKYLYARNIDQVDEKMKNIAFFKSRFCGEIEINITVDHLTKIK